MLPLGTSAPGFTLKDAISGHQINLAEVKSDIATVIMFICNHCPFVKHIAPKLVEVVQEYQDKRITFIGINSNDYIAYPADNPEKMKETAAHLGFTFPYLIDDTQEVAKAYHAACTPDIFAFDKDLKCVYRGRFDGATPGNNVPVTGNDLRQALDQILNSESVSQEQRPSMGCNIKWK